MIKQIQKHATNKKFRKEIFDVVQPYLKFKKYGSTRNCFNELEGCINPPIPGSRSSILTKWIGEIEFHDTIGNMMNSQLRGLTQGLSNIGIIRWNTFDKEEIVCYINKDHWFSFGELVQCIAGHDQEVRLHIQKILFKYLT